MLLLKKTDKLSTDPVSAVGTNNPDRYAGWIKITHHIGFKMNGNNDLEGFIDRPLNKT